MKITSQISLETEHDLGIIRIDNPPGNFLIKPEFIPVDTLQEWVGKNLLKGILICGTGKHFSGGADLDTLLSMSLESEFMESEINKGKAVLRFIKNLNIPVIAAIKGVCFGGGLEIALSCHIRICSSNALFAFPETNHGIMPGLGGINSFQEQTSYHETMKFILSGDMINPEEAKIVKLVDYIVPADDLIPYSLTLLKKMTEGRSLKVINYVMKALHNTRTMTLEEASLEETRMFCELAKEEMRRRMNNEE